MESFAELSPQLGLDADASGSNPAPAPAEAPHPPVDFNLHPGEMGPMSSGPSSGAIDDVFGHYAEPPAPATPSAGGGLGKAVTDLGKRDGVQIDKQGIGATTGDWKYRAWPINPLIGPK